MSNDGQFLSQVGFNLIVKVVRIAVGTVCYGAYVLLVAVSTIVLCRKGWRSKGVPFLLVVTLVMFAGSSLFLAMDITDIVERLKIILIDNPDQGINEKQARADGKLERFVWTGEMLFIFMLILGDSVVIWRTWALYRGRRKFLILPFFTWVGSVVAGFFELGCDVKTGWSLADPNPSAGSVGSETCAKADTSSFTLSYATNIICTLLILYKTWQHRQSMSTYLGSARRKTQVEGILTLLVESGAIYLALYTFQAIPIYGGSFSSGSLVAVEAVNAIIQQAMGIYPTAIIVLVEMQKSLWDTPELSQDASEIRFASRTAGQMETEDREHSTNRVTLLRTTGEVSTSGVSTKVNLLGSSKGSVDAM